MKSKPGRLFCILMIALSVPCCLSAQEKTAGDTYLAFLEQHPGDAALQIFRNDRPLVSYHADRIMPLASTVKILIAIEYARQVAAGIQNPEELIPETLLDRFYVPGTDGGAHPAWKLFLQKEQIDLQKGIPLKEVVNGMIIFSSNADAEYLMDKLGLEKINTVGKSLGIRQEKIYPFVSALFMANQFPGLSGDSLVRKLRSLNRRTYLADCSRIHLQLKNDSTGQFKKTLPVLTLDLQKVWSDRLPGSDAADYAKLMQKIAAGNYFPPKVQSTIATILGWPMILNPANKAVYKQLGMKGGSTAFCLTLAAYAEDLENNKTALCLLFNHLSLEDRLLLQKDLNAFLVEVFNNAAYREKLATALP